MSIVLPASTLHGTTGAELKVKQNSFYIPFIPICEEIEKDKQSWSIQPILPIGVSIDSKSGIISGICSEKIKSKFVLKVSGSGKEFKTELNLSILKPLPSDIVNLISNLSTDGSSIGHGLCEFIDNSIDADATKIDILMNHELFSNDLEKIQRPWLIIDDNGKGISKNGEVNGSVLAEALGWATSPDKEYCQSRLGAYGVGLPAAALTSAKFCTIFTVNNGKRAIGHMSYDDLDSGYLRFFELEDIPSFLTQADSFKQALKLFEKKKVGTIILLQDHYKVNSKIHAHGTELNYQSFKEEMNVLKSRLRDYLSLVYHHFLQTGGIELRKSDGEIIKRKITINFAGKLIPLDPLMEYDDSKTKGKLGTHIHEAEQNVCNIDGKSRYYSVKMAILPGTKKKGGRGRKTKNGGDFDKAMANALAIFRSEETSSVLPNAQELQGLYFYRNFRLIEWAVWKGIYKLAPGSQVARVGVYPPLGLPIDKKDTPTGNDFGVDQRKRKIETTGFINEEIKKILSKSRRWHVDDPKQHSIIQRAKERGNYDQLGNNSGSVTNPVQTLKEAIISPPMIKEKLVPYIIKFYDQTPIKGKSPNRVWMLDNVQVGTEKECNVEIKEPGEHKLILTIESGKQKWQKSLKFRALGNNKTPETPNKKDKKSWSVILIEKQVSDPPIVLNGEVYELNQNNPNLDSILEKMGLLLDE